MDAQNLTFFVPKAEKWIQLPGTNASVIRTGAMRPETSAPAKPLQSVVPLDLTEIPAAMQKMGWNVAAALLNNWFHYTPKNQPRDVYTKINGFSADRSHVYPSDRFNRSAVKLDWILSFPRAAEAFGDLQRKLDNGNAHYALRQRLSAYAKEGRQSINALDLSKNDVDQLHHRFQFQMLPVDTTALSKADVFFRALFLHHGVPDDLAGALGGFGFYAAVAEARFNSFLGRTTAEVTKIALYMKNPYSFFDDAASGSQYLGHWNKDGILLVPEGYAAQRAHAGAWSRYPVQPEGPYGRTFRPVHNVDFRSWQDKHNAGGDMILYSDFRVIKLRSPIKLAV